MHIIFLLNSQNPINFTANRLSVACSYYCIITNTQQTHRRNKSVIIDFTDQHYDVVSAFIKSMRGSDPDVPMFIILLPSETKAAGGDGSPLDFAILSFPMLNPTREDIASDLIRLHLSEALGVLGVSKKQQRLVECNKVLLSSPTLSALFRFTSGPSDS